MDGPTRIRTLAQFRAVVSSGTGLVITDSAHEAVFHLYPARCAHIKEHWFERKVITNAERNGSYFAVASVADAREHWPDVSGCKSAACSEEADGVLGRQDPYQWLAALLRDATGFEDMRARAYEPFGVEVVLEDAQSTQRIALGLRGESLSFCSWPGELKPQAKAFYKTDRAARLLAIVNAENPWVARPKPHLAYFLSKPTRNLYLSCELGLDEYVRRWSESDGFDRVGGHHAKDTIRQDLWPWLQQRGFVEAGSTDELELDDFIERLGQREAHLRPGIEVERVWELADAAELDERGELVREICSASEELLAALREPLPPAARGG